MTRRPAWGRRLSAFWRRDELEHGLTDEIQFHIDQQTEKNIRRGMALEDARRHARVAFGGHDDIKQQIRDGQGWVVLESLIQDIRYALRMLRKAPGFTAIAVLTLALGIGSTTTTFSVCNGLRLRAPPVPDASDLVVVSSTTPADMPAANRSPVSAADYLDWRDQATDFESLIASDFEDVTVSGGMTPQVVPGARVSSNFFRVLGVQPILGRLILPGDERADTDPIAVLSEDVWRATFGGDRRVLGRPIKINGASYVVAGVVPERFLPWDFDAQIWIPLDFPQAEIGSGQRSLRVLRVFARLRPG